MDFLNRGRHVGTVLAAIMNSPAPRSWSPLLVIGTLDEQTLCVSIRVTLAPSCALLRSSEGRPGLRVALLRAA
jgi:hypothetical protein